MIDNYLIRTIILSAPNYSSLKSGFEIVWLVILCILVVAASYFVTKYVGNTQIRKRKNSNFELLDACSLGSHKYLQLIKIGNKFIVISVCKDSISYITELSEDEIVLKNNESFSNNFNEIFSKIINKKNNTKLSDNNITADSNTASEKNEVTENSDLRDNKDNHTTE